MATILNFPRERTTRHAGGAGETPMLAAKVLFFTGVFYQRLDDDAGGGDARRGDRKRGRRPRPDARTA